MILEQGLWAYCHKSKLFGRLTYGNDYAWLFYPVNKIFGYSRQYGAIDWPNLQIFTMREVK